MNSKKKELFNTLIKKLALKFHNVTNIKNVFLLYPLSIKKKYFKNIEYKKIIWMDQAFEFKKKKIETSAYTTSFGPKNLNGKQRSCIVKTPEIWLYEFKNAHIISDSSHIITEEAVFIERIQGVNSAIANYSTGFILEHSDKGAIVRNDYSHIIDKGFFCGGNGSWNYYHWLIELLPKLRIFIKSRVVSENIKILISPEVQTISSFNRLLNEILNGINVNIIFMERFQVYKVQQLFYITTPNNIVFNLRGNNYFKPSYAFINHNTLNSVKKDLIKIEHNMPFPKNKKLFLARRSDIRCYNQKEVFRFFSKYGYKEIYPEDYPIGEQINLFSNASHIVGPTGAAWTNLLFCRNGTKGLCWMSEDSGDFSAFSNLANLSGVDLRYFYYKSNQKIEYQRYHSDYFLDIKVLSNAFNKFI